jgi:hypothetical protein
VLNNENNPRKTETADEINTKRQKKKVPIKKAKAFINPYFK